EGVISPTTAAADGSSASAPRGIPMSIVSTAPACALPGAIHNPGLPAWKVPVTAARTATPETTPVEASTPLGTPTLTTGAPAPLVAAMTPPTGPRGSPSQPGRTRAATATAAGAEPTAQG